METVLTRAKRAHIAIVGSSATGIRRSRSPFKSAHLPLTLARGVTGAFARVRQ